MTTTTYTIDAFLSTQSDESDPDPYFEMTTHEFDELENTLRDMICDDMYEQKILDVVLTERPYDVPNVTMFDIVAIRSIDRHDDDVIGIAYIETTH
jgi:hypothetical protein